MKEENEVLAASTPPAVGSNEGAVEQSNSQAVEGIHSISNIPNQDGDVDEKAPEENLKKYSGHTKLPFGSFPDVEHKTIEMELMEAKQRIEKLQFDLANAEKNLADGKKEQSKEICSLPRELQPFAAIGEDEVKSLESEGAPLAEKLNDSKGEEVADLQSAKQGHEECVSQVDGDRKKVHMLEKQVVDLNEQAKEAKDNLSREFEACQAELATKSEALESIKKVHNDLQLELHGVKSKSEKSAIMTKERVFTLESMLGSAQDQLKASEEAALLLHAENASLKSNLSELSTSSEEKLKQLAGEHQQQLKAHKERSEALQKSLSKLEERTSHMQGSLDAARSDTEVARGKVADLELELESLKQTKSKSAEGAAELQVRLKSMEEMISKQVDSLKVAEENADTTSEQVVHLQRTLKTAEEKLRTSEEAAITLLQQVADLTFKERRSTEHLKEVESKLESFKAVVPQLEEKVVQLQDSLSAAIVDGDGAKQKVTELEVELASLHHNQGELVKKVSFFEDKCSQHESTSNVLSKRVMELEGLITQHKIKAEDLSGKVATQEADLVNSQNKVTDLEMQLRLAKDSSLLLENRSAIHIAELEKSSEKYVATIEELHKMLTERQHEIDSVTSKTDELKLSIGALESDLKGASEREMLVNIEKTSVTEKLTKLEALTAQLEGEKSELESSVHQHKSLIEKGKIDLHEVLVVQKKLRDEIMTLQAAMSRTEEEKQATTTQLESAMKNFSELNDQLVEERQQLHQQIATIMEENGDLRERMASSQEKLHVALAAAELSAKQVQEGCLKESILRDQVEDLNLGLKKAHVACAHVETLEQEKESLAQQFASAQEKLHATLEAAQLSARDLETALLKESTLYAENEELRVQLRKAIEACSFAEQSLERGEHQASRLAAVADVAEEEEQQELLKSQKIVSDQESHVKELDLRSVKSFEAQPSDSSGKARNRKKKAVTWESDAANKQQVVHKPQQHNLNHYIAHLLIALISLTIGFWLARKVHA